MLIDDVKAKESIINEYFGRGRHINCNMIYLNQNLFSLGRQNIGEICNLSILFKPRGKSLTSIYQDLFHDAKLTYKDFFSLCKKLWGESYNYIVIDLSKNKNLNGKLRINWVMKVF